MDELYRRIGELTAEYIKLNEQFVQSTKDDCPASELSEIKEKIKVILEEIERLEKQRLSASTDKDSLPL